jgi:uncharacterized repeat protein (TIGR03803 family)
LVQGADPDGPLTFGIDGHIYGVTYEGGSGTGCGTYGCGTVFELSPSSSGGWEGQVIYSFPGTDGIYPSGGVVFDAAGNLYGVTSGTDNSGGCGTVYELSPTASGWAETTLYEFGRNPHDACGPTWGVTIDKSGRLYGAAGGGAESEGAVFQLARTQDGTWIENVIHSFSGIDGYIPSSGLIVDSSGNLYGTTSSGGDYSQGNVFKLSRSGSEWVLTTLFYFPGSEEGSYPVGAITFDTAGNLYGTTLYGGVDNVGIAYELAPADGLWQFSILHSFTGVYDGGYPDAGMVFDNSGNLYGTTSRGGSLEYGTIFELSPSGGGTWTENVLYNFTNGIDGADPQTPLTFRPSGELYGTDEGGTAKIGLVYRLTL